MMKLSSPAFAPQSEIPARYTCEGEGRAPPLWWSGVPGDAAGLVLIVDDPDVPDPAAPERDWVHWLLYNLPPGSTGLATGGALPADACEGLNDWGRAGYGGPCPPIGRHRYFFRLYALDEPLPVLPHATRAAVERAMRGHVLAQAELVGTYCKRGE